MNTSDQALLGSYNHGLVVLSVVIAIVAAYAALDLAGRVTSAGGRGRFFWLSGGAIAMGTGIWSMHYIGMLAFRLPIPVLYDWPTVVLSLLAAVSGIDVALYEAARVDGATRWQSFLFITLPQLRIISVVLCILMTIYSVNDFDTPWLLTQGGPAHATENLIVLAYKYTFATSKVGIGSAISFFTLIVMMICVFFLLRQQKAEAEA